MAPSKQQKAGLSKIDHVLISHFHGDHMDGLRALSKMIPIDKIYDHGDSSTRSIAAGSTITRILRGATA